MTLDTEDKQKPGKWRRIARRWSGRGRVRTVALIAALVFSRFDPICAGSGLFVFACGLFLHWVAKGHLVRNQQLCQGGPYAFVRHPFYLANFLLDSGLCLLAGAWWLALLYLVVFPLAYLPRILAEEDGLTERFGPAFDEYRRRTPALFPRSLPRPFAWAREVRYENLRLENELSRLLRLSCYPFLLAAVILSKQAWHIGLLQPSLLASCWTMALSLWVAAEVVHRFTEDNVPAGSWRGLRFLSVAWLALPLLPLANGPWATGPWLMLHEPRLLLGLGLALAAVGLILTFVAIRINALGGPAIAIIAFGCLLFCQQVTLAAPFALVAWLGCYFSNPTLTARAGPMRPTLMPMVPGVLLFAAVCAYYLHFSL